MKSIRQFLWVSILLMSATFKTEKVHKSGICYYSREGHMVEGYFIETTERSLLAYLQAARKDTTLNPEVYELHYRHFPQTTIEKWKQVSSQEGRFVYWQFVEGESFQLTTPAKNKIRGINLSTADDHYYFEFEVKGELK